MIFDKAGELFEYKEITAVPNSDMIFIEAVARRRAWKQWGVNY